MALAFPTGTAPGQVHTVGNRTWEFDGTKWNRQPKAIQNLTVSETAPAAPVTGQRWIDTENGKLYFYVDGNWVQAQIL